VEVFALPPLPGPRLESGRRGARERERRLQEFLQCLDHLRVALTEEQTTPGHGRCLMITSATAAEGKTTLSAQLAACCVKAGVSTLLIDADMRRATLSRMLNEEKTPGLSDVLQGDLSPDDSALPVPDAGFHLLPAGTPGRDPSWLLKGQKVGQVLERYRQLFDLIIVDTPPVLPVPDALTIGRWVDGAVLATRFDVSRLPLVEKARRRISTAGITLVKTVVNGVKSFRLSGYISSYGYGYGYGGYGYGGYGGYGYGDRDRAAVSSEPSAVAAPEADGSS
jgi:succinoglycan biosynthesis transport protein ExoP